MGIKKVTSPGSSTVRKTRFTEFLIRENALDKGGFKEWIFCPGMLFNAPDKWWGDQGKRDKPHEGLDLCLYRDRRGRVLRVDAKTRIPVVYDGEVVGVVNDFLGESVIIEHAFPQTDDRRLCTIYGHTNPQEGLHVGRIVKEGEIIAALAHSGKSKPDMFPHLHISLGWASKSISYDQLDWDTIGASNVLTLLDPLDVIDWPYQLVEDVSPSRLA
ncbi:MAG: peptidoglycan DD-metalloendopeptidase family protein [Thermodesulfobacteriota bacterium]|nr:peptidoglycan DD-metalloendopeptidase family protein [Thermodesulfobacteriota bacterium]